MLILAGFGVVAEYKKDDDSTKNKIQHTKALYIEKYMPLNFERERERKMVFDHVEELLYGLKMFKPPPLFPR